MSQLKLITEYNNLSQISEATEDSKDMFVEGIFSTAELKNKNGRRYRKDTLMREVDKLQEMISSKRLYGELDHPASPEINLDRVAIMIENLYWKGDHLMGKAKILDTPMGKIAKSIIKDGGSIGISSRGLGNVLESGYVDDQSYNLITYDLVGNPSNGPSWMNGIYEGKTFGEVNTEEDIKEDKKNITLDEAKKEYEKYVLSKVNDIIKLI